MMERTLILVKHAGPEIEPDVPPNRWRLSEEGRRDSVILAERLRRYGPEVVVSSKEPKAAEMAKIVAERLGANLILHPGLHEHDRTGAAFGTEEEFHLSARSFFENPEKLVWGNETAGQTLERFARAIHDVLERRRESCVAVVAHGTVNTLFLARYGDVDAYAFWRGLGLPSFFVLSLPEFKLRDAVHDIRA